MKELLRRIRDNNILLEVVDGKLQVFTVDTEIDPALLNDIKTRKEELLRFLSDNQQEEPFTESIPPAPQQDSYPLSSAQRRLWMVSQSASASLAYHMAKSFRLRGELDETAFEHAFNQLIARHESLRTVFREIEPGQVRQIILPVHQSGFRLAYYNLLNDGQKETAVKNHVQKLLKQPFNLSSGPMIRASLVRTEADEWVFTYVMHHIISDGWSMEVMIKELLALYQKSALKPLRIQYKDYAVWQQEQLNAAHHKEYWANQLDGELPVLALPIDHPRGAARTYNGGMVHKQLSTEVMEKLKALLSQEGATLFMGLVAAVNSLLHRYTGQTDIITGNPTAGREHVDLEGQIGLYLNAMALRARFSASDSFRELLQQTKKTTLEAYKHRSYPFDQVVSALNIPREAGRNALFDVFIDLHEQDGETTHIGGLTVTQLETGEHTVSKFDLTFMFTQSTLSLEYNSDLYERETAERMMEHFEGLLNAAVNEPDKAIGGLSFLNDSEINRILSFNDIPASYIRPVSVVDLIEQQDANAQAVVFNNTTLNYKELNEKANQLAHYIKNDLVGIMLDRSEKLIIAILAVLKAGAAYVPIDPDYPAARKSYIMQDTGIKMLLTQTDYLFELGDYSGEVFAMDAQLDALDTPTSSPGISGELAYIIYTSGSTGLPKGCCISNKSLSAYIQWANRCYFNNEKASFGLFTSLSFDLTVTSIFCSLTSGGTLTVFDQRQELPEILAQNFNGNINSIKLTPSHINILKQLDVTSAAISCAVVGGEEVTDNHVNTLKKINPAIKIYNEYGPTEATVGCIVALLERNEPITIGKPIAGAAIYILDNGGSICPIGVPGEIHIAGAGLAVKYLNKPELTAEKFISSPYGRMYKTGDLGKWLPDGSIKFLGRKDDQVKIRGYRIELGEIDHALSCCAGVNAAITVVRSNELVAYIATKENIADIKDQLSKALPAYMIPAHFVKLDHLPLTSNGKIDKKNLPPPEDADTDAYQPPRNEIEANLATVLEEVLDKKRVSVTDNFFALGGDSIKAITFVVNIHKQLGYKLSINKLYENPTIEKIAACLDNRTAGNDVHDYHTAGLEEIEKISEQIIKEDQEKRKLPRQYEDIYPVVPIEQGMIFSSMLNPNEPVYYDQFSFIIKIEDIGLFTEGLSQLVRRHSILRTKYYMSSFSVPVKAVLPELDLPLTYQDISNLSKEEKTSRIRQYVESDLKIRLSFDDEILWRINMFRLEGNEHYITYSFHHAMLDGWSVSVFKTEIANFHRKDLRPLRHSYKDYCAISLGKRHDPATGAFWKELLQGYTRNKLPFNFKGTRIKEEYGMKKVQRTINKSVLDKLNQLAGSQKLSFKAICLAAHVYLMHLVCSEQDVTTGMVTHERPEIEDGENILGCFLTTVPIRISFDKLTDILSLLKQVNDFLLNAKAHEIHLADIARFIGDKTSFGNPIFDTILNYTDFHRFEDVSEGALINILEAGENVSDLEVSHEMTNTLFDVEVGKTLDKFTARIKYVPGFFNEEDVRYALNLYVRILEAFAGNVHTNLSSLNLLTAEEMKEVLIDFNATAAPYATEMTLDRLFEEQVIKTPDGIALRQDGIRMSYRELNERSNQLARHLTAKGVKSGDNIGLHATRSFSMIIGMYGILKAGGAYVPIDPEYPTDRQEYIVQNSGVQTVVSHTKDFLSGLNIITMDELGNYSTENPNIEHSSRQLAYTIYTSGSTGRPKGVMIEHHSAVNLVQWVNKEYNIGTNDRLLFITSMCFDLSVYDIFGMLAAGGTVVIARNEEVQQISLLKNLLKEERITFWDSVPTTMNYLVTELDAAKDDFIQHELRVVFLSGDWIPVQLPDRIRKYFPSASVISLGGATEGTVWSNYFPISHVHPNWSSIPYGKPITNNSFYILNDQLQPVPKGVAGELYIGGVGVAKGYANDPVKTAASFKPDPFNQQWGGMMYKTGDLGRMMPDGNMEFLGRKDNQVKIRGFRVELGEIESVLQRHESVKGAIADVFKDSNNMNQLCAYLIPEHHLDVPEIKEYLKNRLPAYMVPAHYMILQSFPLNSNGKINRKALPRPAEDGKTSLSAYVPPVTETQKQVAQIWRSILNTERLSIRDDLFEQGANSLSIGAFVNRVHREMGLAINLRDVFIHPTIEAISGEIEKIKWAGGELFEMETSDTENFSI